MSVEREELARWIFGFGDAPRFTQDSPVMPEVWFRFGEQPNSKHDLLLTPHADSHAAALARELDDRLEGDSTDPVALAYNEGYVVARLRFEELVRIVLPLSDWWLRHVWPQDTHSLGALLDEHAESIRMRLGREGEPQGRPSQHGDVSGHLVWLVGVVGQIEAARRPDTDAGVEGEAARDPARIWNAARRLLGDIRREDISTSPVLWSVNMNRAARPALWRSRVAIKADAATRVFGLSCATLRWAIVDSGIDARHPAFRRREVDGSLRAEPFPVGANNTRVVASYDFTKLRTIVGGQHAPVAPALNDPAEEAVREVRDRLRSGRAVDWGALEPVLRIPHDAAYRPPLHEHGTHVAGILAADWRRSDPGMPFPDHDLCGMCPDIELYDLRVFDDQGAGDEFGILAALQFVRYLNAHSDLQVIHGVNQSLSLSHDVRNYACGRTPICDESERLTRSGVVVVAAAGNEGRAQFATAGGLTEGYRSMTVTDPGNSDEVITVGATHRFMPHTYGVSYFSSRGPTGDGRLKPDLVAPGEKINAPVPNEGARAMDGTSMAAPHVSGAAALLMARHDELIAQPARIKRVLCGTATDLGRERYFQGSGMLDVLRAIQSV